MKFNKKSTYFAGAFLIIRVPSSIIFSISLMVLSSLIKPSCKASFNDMLMVKLEIYPFPAFFGTSLIGLTSINYLTFLTLIKATKLNIKADIDMTSVNSCIISTLEI